MNYQAISKLNKEKKNQEEVNCKVMDDFQAEEDKVNHMNKVKAKLESSMDEVIKKIFFLFNNLQFSVSWKTIWNVKNVSDKTSKNRSEKLMAN